MSLGMVLKFLKMEREKIHIAAKMTSPFKKMLKQPEAKWTHIIKDEIETITTFTLLKSALRSSLSIQKLVA